MNDTLQNTNHPLEEGSAQTHTADMKHIIEKLKENYTFFSDMGEDEVTELLGMCKKIAYEEGHQIFREGEIADRFYLVLSGEIGISIKGTEVAHVKAGQIFGEMALLEHIPRTASATAMARTMLFSLPAEVVSTMMPNLALKVVINIARQMSEKLRENNSHIQAS